VNAERCFQAADRGISPKAKSTYGAFLVEVKRFEEARRLLDLSVAAWPGYSRGYSNRAVLHYRLGEMEEARRDAETALRLDPDNIQAARILHHQDTKKNIP
jgi:tetratricopeptide (TPR) repeat protein